MLFGVSSPSVRFCVFISCTLSLLNGETAGCGVCGSRYLALDQAGAGPSVRVVVLKPGVSKPERRFIAQMLNAAFEYRWLVGAAGEVHVDHDQAFRQFSSYDGLTKHADAVQLDELAELKARKLGLRLLKTPPGEQCDCQRSRR